MNNGGASSTDDEGTSDLDPVSYTALRLVSLIWCSEIIFMTNMPSNMQPLNTSILQLDERSLGQYQKAGCRATVNRGTGGH